MRVMIIGNGGREHAICRALMTTTPQVQTVVAPGNGGTAGCAGNLDVSASNVEGLVELARSLEVDLVVPGPEAPLVEGIADAMAAANIACCGPSAQAAKLEGSKAFMRELTSKAGVPGPAHRIVRDESQLEEALAAFDAVPVVKADGLAAGKGVFLGDNKAACASAAREMLSGSLGDAGRVVVLEERLSGTEASLFFACDGSSVRLLPHARDYKRVGDGDLGPNTGGMGAISPNPDLDDETVAAVRARIVEPTLAALEAAGTPFVGFLFAGVILTAEGPKLLEFNARLGDPEAQAILPRLQPGAFLHICQAISQRSLDNLELGFDEAATCAVVLCAEGYPKKATTGDRIEIDPGLYEDDRWLDHAGTALTAEGTLVTAGGRVAAVVARGSGAAEARARAYKGVELVRYRGKHFRTDIGLKAE